MRLFIFGMMLMARTVACGGEEEPAKTETKTEEKKAEKKADKAEEKKTETTAPAKAKGGKAKGGN